MCLPVLSAESRINMQPLMLATSTQSLGWHTLLFRHATLRSRAADMNPALSGAQVISARKKDHEPCCGTQVCLPAILAPRRW